MDAEAYRDALCRAHQMYLAVARFIKVLVKGGHRDEAEKLLETLQEAQQLELMMVFECLNHGLTSEQIQEALKREFMG